MVITNDFSCSLETHLFGMVFFWKHFLFTTRDGGTAVLSVCPLGLGQISDDGFCMGFLLF